jgi:hypothetical protein
LETIISYGGCDVNPSYYESTGKKGV